ncbi:hypothetical protein SRABI128_05814 [Microbacterium sp. Bi128]|nr:hypothetical protein SRABI128_05814 [Microbacterium sp. Bi128]
MDYVGAELQQAVDDAEDGVFVARDQAGREDDGVPLAADDAVVAVGHAGQGGHGLTLGAGGHQHNPVVRQVVDVLDVDQDPGRDLQVAQFRGDGHVPDHGAAHEGNLAVVVGGGVENLLDAVHVRGEGRDDDALGGLPEQPVQGGPDFLLGGGEAGDVGIGRIRHEQVHAFFAQLGEVPEVGDAAIQRELVHLEVTGVQDGAARGAEEHGQGVRDGVVDGDELAFEGPVLLDLALDDDLRVRLDPVFLQLGLDEGQCQL